MGTLRNVWERLTALLALALQAKGRAPTAKADPKKVAGAVQQFTTHFLPLFAQIEKQYKAKQQIEVGLKKAAEDALKLAQTLKQQIDAANKDGFTDGELRENLGGRLEEIIDRLRELKNDGFSVQWD